nr:immunoglobulin heavy chain junction region [Mus musculus]
DGLPSLWKPLPALP